MASDHRRLPAYDLKYYAAFIIDPDGHNIEAVCRSGGDALTRGIEQVAAALPRDRHIFNLGHGMRPGTPPEHVDLVIKHLRKLDG